MPKFSGSFFGNVKLQTALTVPDQPNHELDLVEVSGKQKTSDEKWNDTTINYWATTDIVGDRGAQSGYFVNDHGADGRDWGTFEGTVTTEGAKITIEGNWKYVAGSGKFKGITGGGAFKTEMSSPREVETTWNGTYELAVARAHAR
jgi:hypothetical protein